MRARVFDDFGTGNASLRYLKKLDELQADIGVRLSYSSPDNQKCHARLLFSLSNTLKLCPERGRTAAVGKTVRLLI